jgi:hypothetical protein
LELDPEGKVGRMAHIGFTCGAAGRADANSAAARLRVTARTRLYNTGSRVWIGTWCGSPRLLVQRGGVHREGLRRRACVSRMTL